MASDTDTVVGCGCVLACFGLAGMFVMGLVAIGFVIGVAYHK